jgi:hypothetical protein
VQGQPTGLPTFGDRFHDIGGKEMRTFDADIGSCLQGLFSTHGFYSSSEAESACKDRLVIIQHISVTRVNGIA